MNWRIGKITPKSADLFNRQSIDPLWIVHGFSYLVRFMQPICPTMKYSLIILFSCLLSLTALGARVDTVAIPSRVMHQTLKAVVILPDAYRASAAPFPVVYLLHGGEGNYRDWTSKTTDKLLLHQMADQYQVIIVTPDGGGMSFYFDSPLDKTSLFETFISKEVLHHIDSAYRTIPNRRGRIIAGLSMGGHGAFYLATRHPDLYGAAAAISGAMDIDLTKWKVTPDFAQSRQANFEHLLGPAPWPGYSVVDLAAQMKTSGVRYIFDCGFDDILIGPNRELHQILLANGTPHQYTERPGMHNWAYFEQSVPYLFLSFHQILSQP